LKPLFPYHALLIRVNISLRVYLTLLESAK
jgi:hypothetical protein